MPPRFKHKQADARRREKDLILTHLQDGHFTAGELYFRIECSAPVDRKDHWTAQCLSEMAQSGEIDTCVEKRYDEWSKEPVTVYRLPTGASGGTYEYITTKDGFFDLLERIDDKPCALDFEGWDYEVRLAQFRNDDVWAVVDFGQVWVEGKRKDGVPKRHPDHWFHDVADWLDDGKWIAFYSSHEKKCLHTAGADPTVWDVAHVWHAIEGGGHLSLKRLVHDVLGIEMDKEEQGSDWNTAAELTQSQLDYAADDALHTWDTWKELWGRATQPQRECFDMLDSLTDPSLAMWRSGLLLDKEYHTELIEHWRELSDDREADIRALITTSEVSNLNSGQQLNDYYSKLLPTEVLNSWPKTPKTGLLSTKNKDLLNMAGIYGGTPLGDSFRLLAERSTLQKYLSSFGQTLLNKATPRVHATYNIAAAITCRFSCSGPNLQQIPRDREFFGERMSVRRGFIAEDGNLLISFDYSGIEMVMLALLSGDEQLLHDVIYGDPHAVMGEYVAGRPIDPKNSKEDKDLRQGMKSVNFGIVYGTTALGLAGRQGWAFTYAEALLNYWAGRYPKAWNLRHEMQEEAKRTGYLTMVDGGTIALGKNRPPLTKCANYPVQRAALTVMARALIRHYESILDLQDRYPRDAKRIMLCASIHDAIIDEAPRDLAPLVMQTMKRDMLDAYYDVFPQIKDAPPDALLEGGLGPSWGELEEV